MLKNADEDARRREQYFDLLEDDAGNNNLPEGHTYETYEDEYTSHCQCGKWIEPGYWEIWDHIDDVLRELQPKTDAEQGKP